MAWNDSFGSAFVEPGEEGVGGLDVIRDQRASIGEDGAQLLRERPLPVEGVGAIRRCRPAGSPAVVPAEVRPPPLELVGDPGRDRLQLDELGPERAAGLGHELRRGRVLELQERQIDRLVAGAEGVEPGVVELEDVQDGVVQAQFEVGGEAEPDLVVVERRLEARLGLHEVELRRLVLLGDLVPFQQRDEAGGGQGLILVEVPTERPQVALGIADRLELGEEAEEAVAGDEVDVEAAAEPREVADGIQHPPLLERERLRDDPGEGPPQQRLGQAHEEAGRREVRPLAGAGELEDQGVGEVDQQLRPAHEPLVEAAPAVELELIALVLPGPEMVEEGPLRPEELDRELEAGERQREGREIDVLDLDLILAAVDDGQLHDRIARDLDAAVGLPGEVFEPAQVLDGGRAPLLPAVVLEVAAGRDLEPSRGGVIRGDRLAVGIGRVAHPRTRVRLDRPARQAPPPVEHALPSIP